MQHSVTQCTDCVLLSLSLWRVLYGGISHTKLDPLQFSTTCCNKLLTMFWLSVTRVATLKAELISPSASPPAHSQIFLFDIRSPFQNLLLPFYAATIRKECACKCTPVYLYLSWCMCSVIFNATWKAGKEESRWRGGGGEHDRERDDAQLYCTSPVGTAQTEVILAGARELEYGMGLAKIVVLTRPSLWESLKISIIVVET